MLVCQYANSLSWQKQVPAKTEVLAVSNKAQTGAGVARVAGHQKRYAYESGGATAEVASAARVALLFPPPDLTPPPLTAALAVAAASFRRSQSPLGIGFERLQSGR